MNDKEMLYIGLAVAGIYAYSQFKQPIQEYVQKRTALIENSTFTTTPLSAVTNTSPFSWANLGKLVTFAPWGVYSIWTDLEKWRG